MGQNAMDDFRRDVTYQVARRDDGTLLLTGTIQDPFHHIVLDVVVRCETLAIADVRVDFRRCPTRDCGRVAQRLQGLVGFPIGPGLTRKLQETLGGGEGCGNLRTLLQGLLPLAINATASAGHEGDGDVLDAIHRRLRGTCAGYAGPAPGER